MKFKINDRIALLVPESMKGLTGTIIEAAGWNTHVTNDYYYFIQLDKPWDLYSGGTSNEKVGRAESEIVAL